MMVKGTIYLEFPCCNAKYPKSRFSRGKWDPWKEVECPECGTPIQLNEMGWFERQLIIHFRDMSWEESSKFVV